jgi:hypothetical protein
MYSEREEKGREEKEDKRQDERGEKENSIFDFITVSGSVGTHSGFSSRR